MNTFDRSRLAAIGIALGITLLRATSVKATDWWKDWILIVCALSIAYAAAGHRRPWPYVVLAAVGWLSGIYLLRQGGAMIAVLGLLP